MPGQRSKNFRGGDISEDLGVLLLKAFCVVAPVPRQEDVGIDAVATLMRDTGDGLLVAEDSFYVQLKSASERTVIYNERGVKWLRQLQLPLFIGSVDKEKGEISLYTTNEASQMLVMHNEWRAVHLRLDEERKYQWPHGVACPTLHPPLLRWSVNDLSPSNKFAEEAIQMVKTVIKTEILNIRIRGLKICEALNWKTNEPHTVRHSQIMHSTNACRAPIKAALEQMEECIAVMGSDAILRRDQELHDLVTGLIRYMQDNDVKPAFFGASFETLWQNEIREQRGISIDNTAPASSVGQQEERLSSRQVGVHRLMIDEFP